MTEAHVVITGGTRGIGHGLARSFLALGCSVTLSGRTQRGAETAAAALQQELGGARVRACGCDVTQLEQVQALWRFATEHAPVDAWINNAGCNAPPQPFWEMSAETVRAIVDTNLHGVLHGSHVAMRGMLAQSRGGAIYNLIGFGSDGGQLPGLLAYGASKRAVEYASQALAREARGTKVRVCTVAPGIVRTDMFAAVYADPQRFGWLSRLIDGLAQPVDAVAPALARRLLDNQRSGVQIRAESNAHLLGRVLLALLRGRPSRTQLGTGQSEEPR